MEDRGAAAESPTSASSSPPTGDRAGTRVTGSQPVVVRSRRALHGATRYAIAVASTGLALAGSLVLEPYLTRILFVLFWPAVLGTAVFAGLGPALLASTLSVLVVDYWFIRPRGALHLQDPTDLIPLAIFYVTSVMVSTLADRRRAAEQRAVAAARSNAVLALELEDQRLELETQLEESQSMSEELEQTTAELEERTEEAEAASAFARGILESISDPFVVHDPAWRFRYVNEAALRIFAGSRRANPATLIGQVLWEVYPILEGTIFEREMRRAAHDRVPVQFEAFYAERGTWSRMSCYPLPDGGLATQWQDISARKRAEEAQHYLDRAAVLLTAPLEPERRLADLAQLVVPELADWCAIDLVNERGGTTRVAVAHVDPSKAQWARELERRYPPNPNAATGTPNVLRTGQPELYPKITDEMLVAGAIDDEHLRISRELGLRSAMIVPLSARGMTIGTLTLVSAESRRRYSEDDLTLAMELARRASLAIDNARQHQAALDAQHSAESANRAKSAFLAAMSHELRTPLNAISGYVDLLLLGVHGELGTEQRADLERVRLAQRHLLSLITEVLEYARLEAGRTEYRVRPVAMSELLADLAAFVEPQLREREIALRCEDPDPALMVRADPPKVRQILLNLLSNSLKFTPRGGLIEIRCGRRDDRALIKVIDTGVGIAAAELERVFEPFVQVHRTLIEPTSGVGLGLAISRDLARGMAGDLTVESVAGAGSTFTLALPLL